jgi:hypothetical protein
VEGLKTQTSKSLHLEKFSVFFKLVIYLSSTLYALLFFSIIFMFFLFMDIYCFLISFKFFLGYKQGFSKNWKFKVDHYGINDHCPNVSYYILDMV